MKRVLFVSYVFPPMAAVGGRRVVDFCKYLPRHGWEPVVLTVKGGTNASWDESQLKKIPDTKIYRSATFEPLLKDAAKGARPQKVYRPETGPVNTAMPTERLTPWKKFKKAVRTFLRVPDENNFWVPMGIRTGMKAIRHERIDAIVSSSPPVSAHLLASILSRLSGKPHIADFRDLWTLNHTYQYRGFSERLKRYDAFWERWMLKHAAGVTVATTGFERQMKGHLGGLIADRVSTITNGFDYEEIDSEQEFPPTPGDKFRILYTGSLYSDFNPVFFLESVAQWLEDRGVDSNTIGIDFYGHCEYDYTDWLKSLGLGETVRFHGFRPQAELATAFQQADCLLLLLSFKPQHSNVIPAKLFEYLAAPPPILALAPQGTTADLIGRHEGGVVITEPEKERMFAILDELYQAWQHKPATIRKYRYIRDIDRNHLAGSLAGELDRVTAV